MLSAAELASIRADAEAAALDLPCSIQRATTPAKDSYGSETNPLTTISPNNLKAGMSQPTAGQLQNYEYKIGAMATWQVKLPVGTDVQEEDIITIGNRELTVQVVLDPRSYAALLTVLASEVK